MCVPIVCYTGVVPFVMTVPIILHRVHCHGLDHGSRRNDIFHSQQVPLVRLPGPCFSKSAGSCAPSFPVLESLSPPLST
ncbi:hypothetical protein CC80DRAFT_289750 [Byssothecium circinans]|uniref:Uncharacterized protein n=1 Tax=Byssothecium circinans TaxID=147558 RepID=A0A6A5U8U7_9PLEO|nr:hypothetical protein CC80DRAFT_289750 [Byssothecium circinans]